MKKFEWNGKWYQELDPKDYKVFDRVECLVRDCESDKWVYTKLVACANFEKASSFATTGSNVWRYCAIPCDPPESRLMTNRELAELLAKGYGELMTKTGMTYARAHYYNPNGEKIIDDVLLICSWDSDEWIKPTINIYNKFLNKEHK